MPKKEEATKNANVLSITGLTGKTFTGLNVWRVGAVDVVEIAHSTGTVFVKFRQGECEVKGDANWGTGTII